MKPAHYILTLMMTTIICYGQTQTRKNDIPHVQTKKAKMKAIILTADGFEDMELFFPMFRLQEAGIHVDVAGPFKGTITGEHGYKFSIEKTFDDIDPVNYDLLILPGGAPGGAPRTVSKSKKAQSITAAFFAENKPVAAICHGPYTLVAAGLVKDRRTTSYWGDGVPEQLKAAGAIWVDTDVVVDHNLITSRWPPDLPAFNREIFRLIGLQ